MNTPMSDVLSAVIARSPLSITAEATVLTAMTTLDRAITAGQAGTVLVVLAAGRVVGLLTAPTLIHRVAQAQPLDQVRVGQVMTPATAVRETELTDLETTFKILQQHRFCPVPVVDHQGALVGLVTEASLLQALDPLALSQRGATLEAEVHRLQAERRDLTQRCHQAEQALALQEVKSQAILTAIPDLMFRVGADGLHRGYVKAGRDRPIGSGHRSNGPTPG
jgi:CBS domain-containing protein